jgi:hypothetical protein
MGSRPVKSDSPATMKVAAVRKYSSGPFQDHVGGVGVDRLVVVVRPSAEVPEVKGQ